MEVPKIRSIEVLMSNGKTVIVHEPQGRSGLKAFLQAMPALTVLQKLFQQVKELEGGVMDYSQMNIPDEVIDAVYGLFGVMTEVTVTDFEAMGVSNQLGLLRGFTLFAPANPSMAVPSIQPEAPAIPATIQQD